MSDTDYKSKILKAIAKNQSKDRLQGAKKRRAKDHKKEFLVALYMGDIKKAEAKASSIKEAEQKAAKKSI